MQTVFSALEFLDIGRRVHNQPQVLYDPGAQEAGMGGEKEGRMKYFIAGSICFAVSVLVGLALGKLFSVNEREEGE